MAEDLVMLTTLQTLSPSVLSSSALALSSAVGWAAVDPPLVYKGINTGKYFFGNTQMWKVKYASKSHLLLSLNTGNHNHVCIWLFDLNKHGCLHFPLHFPVVWVSIEMAYMNMYETLETVFAQISKHCKIQYMYCIFIQLSGFGNIRGQTWS